MKYGEYDPGQQATGITLQELRLKDKSEEELFAYLLQSGEMWTEQQRASIEAVYNLASIVHKDDTYKDKPYIYHLLRVANRLTGYLHIKDPEMVIAALLHDSVEDHVLQIIKFTAGSTQIVESLISDDPHERQRLALTHLGELFSPRVAEIVASVTNAPSPTDSGETYDEWLARYQRKVEQAASTPEGCLIKFSDWCDNGLGLVHSEEPEGSPKLAGYKRKYVLALPVFEHRFQDTDVLDMLDAQARAYVANQLILGRERLAQS